MWLDVEDDLYSLIFLFKNLKIVVVRNDIWSLLKMFWGREGFMKDYGKVKI